MKNQMRRSQNPPNMPYFTTLKRRMMQPLWDALDATVAPILQSGIVCAISGGNDSRALLEALATWPKRSEVDAEKIHVLCVDHRLRWGSDDEAQAVAARAAALGLCSAVRTLVDIHATAQNHDEASLRKRRYEILKSYALLHELPNIVVAQHADDNIEGYWLDLVGQGGGTQGAAMNLLRSDGEIRIVRPFLGLRRTQLMMARFVVGADDIVLDRLDTQASNARAYTRQHILPTLQAHFPALPTQMLRKANEQRDEQEALEHYAHLLQQQAHHDENTAYRWSWEVIRDVPDAVLRKTLMRVAQQLQPHADMRSSAPVVAQAIRSIKSAQHTDHTQKIAEHASKQFQMAHQICILLQPNGVVIALRSVTSATDRTSIS